MRWTWHYADGTSEEVLLRNGVEFADWIRPVDVPGSAAVEGLVPRGRRGQVRRFSLAPGRDAVVERITLAMLRDLVDCMSQVPEIDRVLREVRAVQGVANSETSILLDTIRG